MTPSIDSVGAAAASAGARETLPTQELGRDEFLRLLVTKLQNQDPLNPSEDTEFISQLATFSSLEQLIAVNDNLQTIGASQGQLINAQALNLIGKEALVESGNEVRIKDGVPDKIVYAVPRQAGEATLTIRDSQGAVVRTIELERDPQGRVTLDWDGTDQDGDLLPDGDYQLDLHVTDTAGDPMAIGLYRSLRIDGVAFVDGEISLVSGDREIPFELILEIREGSTSPAQEV
jgi:flagellar basal-body rod modification protein FlgD